ncbi:Multidrug resistance-associated protein 5 [Nymphon striatum]|nr:Multidrug resistance-associated protein 5 [Nymphon striatum]
MHAIESRLCDKLEYNNAVIETNYVNHKTEVINPPSQSQQTGEGHSLCVGTEFSLFPFQIMSHVGTIGIIGIIGKGPLYYPYPLLLRSKKFQDGGQSSSSSAHIGPLLSRGLPSRSPVFSIGSSFHPIPIKRSYIIHPPSLRSTPFSSSPICYPHCGFSGPPIACSTGQVSGLFLEYFDEVILMEGGRIKDVGSHHSLLQSSVNYNNLIASFENLQKCEDEKMESPKMSPVGELNKGYTDADGNARKDADTKLEVKKESVRRPSQFSSPDTDTSEEEDDDDNSIINRQLDNNEKLEKGHISWYTYKNYIHSSGGYLVCFFVVFTLAINVGCGTFSSWWLSRWLNAGSGNSTVCEIANSTEPCDTGGIGNNPDLNYYQAVYAMSVCFVLITNILRAIIFTKSTLKASTNIHNTLFKKVIMSPMKFFDYTPIGRILNLFTKDQEVVDTRLPLRIEILFQYFFIILFALIVVAVIIPWMFLAVTIFSIVFYYIHKIFHSAIRDIKRLQNVSWPGVFSHLATTMQGVDSIRVYHKTETFVERFDQLYDQCSAPLYLYNCANRWIGIRLEAIAISMTMVTAILTVVLRDKISPAYAGLALSYTVLAEADFTSYERQLSYSEILKSEESEMKEKNEKIVLQECPENWPIRGRISFQNVSMRYQPTLLPVLRGVTFDVFPGEKIGIIGRTGAGKSSLGVVLFRLVEISTGLIYIDGIDISTLPLHDLRSKLSIIPQDPIMFEGTLRDNLDPTGEYTDNELWKALEKSFMKSKIVSLGGHLLAPVRANGNNFSVGQRQLLCLARAILKKSKIILLDEATASIDMETDALIQRTLQDFFGNSTVLTIAHRLHTVKGCDRILVMHNGRVAEFDEPTRLLVNPKSLFSTMMAASTTE